MNGQPKQTEFYFVFAAYIDQLAVQRFFDLTAKALQSGADRLHILMQTNGGNVQDGVCLYNFFRALPVEVIAYNVGSIASAGAWCRA
jgi:ATP-dependent Clp protease, protease subunit